MPKPGSWGFFNTELPLNSYKTPPEKFETHETTTTLKIIYKIQTNKFNKKYIISTNVDYFENRATCPVVRAIDSINKYLCVCVCMSVLASVDLEPSISFQMYDAYTLSIINVMISPSTLPSMQCKIYIFPHHTQYTHLFILELVQLSVWHIHRVYAWPPVLYLLHAIIPLCYHPFCI